MTIERGHGPGNSRSSRQADQRVSRLIDHGQAIGVIESANFLRAPVAGQASLGRLAARPRPAECVGWLILDLRSSPWWKSTRPGQVRGRACSCGHDVEGDPARCGRGPAAIATRRDGVADRRSAQSRFAVALQDHGRAKILGEPGKARSRGHRSYDKAYHAHRRAITRPKIERSTDEAWNPCA
jgi:hypothetical protein